MNSTDADRNAVGQRVSEFVRATETAAPDLTKDDFAALKSDEGRERFAAVLGELATTKFVDASEALIGNQGDQVEGILQGAGGSPGLGDYILRAFHQRICTNKEVSDDLRKELERIEKSGIKITSPSAAGILGGTGVTVTILVASAISGPLAAVLAPLAGGVALLILVIGLDGFCAWLPNKNPLLRAAPEDRPRG
jgi:hypothetical protein